MSCQAAWLRTESPSAPWLKPGSSVRPLKVRKLLPGTLVLPRACSNQRSFWHVLKLRATSRTVKLTALLPGPWVQAALLSFTLLGVTAHVLMAGVPRPPPDVDTTEPTALLDPRLASPTPKLVGLDRAPVKSPAAAPKGLTDFEGWARKLAPAADSAFLASVLQIVYEQGAEAGTRRVMAYSKERGPPATLAVDQMTHAVGAYAFHRYGRDPKIAWSHCLPDHEWACYHTVARQYLETLPSFTIEDMPRLCERVFESYPLQCGVGMGHSLLYLFGFDVAKAVRYCVALATPISVEGCSVGLFAQHTRQGHAGVVSAFVIPDDPLYPCNTINAMLDICYFYRAQAFSRMTEVDGKSDGHKVARMCEEVPQQWKNSCYRSIGVMLYTDSRFGTGGFSLEQVALTCREIKGNIDACLTGAVTRAMGRRDYPSEKGRPYCEAVRELEERRACDDSVAAALAAEVAER